MAASTALSCTARVPGSGASNYQCMGSKFVIRQDGTVQCAVCKTTYANARQLMGLQTHEGRVAALRGLVVTSTADDFAAAHSLDIDPKRGYTSPTTE